MIAMRAKILGALGLIAAIAACGGGAETGGSSGGAGGKGGAGGENGSSGGGGGASGACELPAAPLHLVFTMPDGRVLDSSLAVDQLVDASADVTGPATVVIGSEIQVTDEVSGDVAKLVYEGTGSPQVNDGQKVHLILRFKPRELGGPDAYQAEVEDATTNQTLFFAVKGYLTPFQGTRVSVTLGKETCHKTDDLVPMSTGTGSGAGYRLKEVVVDAGGGTSVSIPNGVTDMVPTKSLKLGVKNQSAAEMISPPETFISVAVAGQAIFPPD